MAKAKKKNFYAVKVGQAPGIYRTWSECEAQVKGYSGAVFQGFSTIEEAKAFMDKPLDNASDDAIHNNVIEDDIAWDMIDQNAVGQSAARNAVAQNAVQEMIQEVANQEVSAQDDPLLNMPYAFVDGSYNSETGAYGYGGFLVDGKDRYPLQGSGPDTEGMQNVNGEIHGAMAAIQLAGELGLKQITLFYDYVGLQAWATGTWNAYKPNTQAYKDFIQSNDVVVNFEKVAAHTGIPGNELADQMAKQACGVEMS